LRAIELNYDKKNGKWPKMDKNGQKCAQYGLKVDGKISQKSAKKLENRPKKGHTETSIWSTKIVQNFRTDF